MVGRGLGHDGRMVWLRRVGSWRSSSVFVLASSSRRRSLQPATTVQMRRSANLARDSWRWGTGGWRARRRSRIARPSAILERRRPRISVSASSSVGGRSPDRPEDLLRHRRDATRLGSARPMADGRGLPGRRLHTALYPRWRRSLSGDRGCSVHLFRHRDERTVRVGGRSPRAYHRRTRRFRRIGGVRRTQADDRGYPCRVLQCDRRFGGDIPPSGVVLLAERTLALSLRWGRRRSRDDGRGHRGIGGRVRRRLRRAVHLT